tara:strand:+ start:1258 stop:2172 length:915 start_codon:yes stop_codon:yes gene_type:complete
MNVLELFSGTKSVGKVCDSLGWNSVSVDLLLDADHQVDIMDFDYKQYPKDYFSLIWASPPCTFYSRLQNCWIGRKRKDGILVTKEWIEEQRKESDKLIIKTFEIINYFNPYLWFLENPQTGTLKDRDIMKNLNYYDVDYCMYSDWGYKKRTRIWTNKENWEGLLCNGKCGNIMEVDNQQLHSERIGTSKTVNDNGKIIRVNTAELRKKYKNHKNLQHKVVLGNGYEMIDGKKVLCNSKEKRDKLKHKLNVSKDVHTIGANKNMKHKAVVAGGAGGGEQINIGGGTDRLDRYRIPPDLIYSLFLD